MSFGTVIRINHNQIAAEFGRATIVKIPGKDKGILVPSRHVHMNGSSGTVWFNPKWDYQVKSGKGLRHDADTLSGEDVVSLFDERNVYDKYDDSMKPQVTDTDAVVPDKIKRKADDGKVESW